jgi:hypothetical protein
VVPPNGGYVLVVFAGRCGLVVFFFFQLFGFFLISSFLSLNDLLLLLPYIFLSVLLLLMLLLFVGESFFSFSSPTIFTEDSSSSGLPSKLGARHVSPRAVEPV